MVSSYAVASEVSAGLMSEFGPENFCIIGGTSMGAHAEIAPGITRLQAEDDQSVVRDNGTLRDIDIIVPTADRGVFDLVTKSARDLAANRMKVSTFCLSPAHRPRSMAHLTRWVSRRVVQEDGTIHHELYPFSAPLPDGVFSHTLQFPDGNTAPTMDPLYANLSYRLRSIGGLRPRDADKVRIHAERLRSAGLWLPEDTTADSESQARYRELLRISDMVTALGETSLLEVVRQRDLLALKIRFAHWYDSQDKLLKIVHTGGEELLTRLGLVR